MKKIILFVIVALTAITACAQTPANGNSSASPDNAVVYRLFPTTNRWTFIKLNTRTGQMWQVQYYVGENDDDYRFETYLSLTPLVPKEREVNGRFFLYPTQNMYNFILLDQLDGRMWQAQWSTEAENRFIIPIE